MIVRLVNNEVERMVKEAVIVEFQDLSTCLEQWFITFWYSRERLGYSLLSQHTRIWERAKICNKRAWTFE